MKSRNRVRRRRGGVSVAGTPTQPPPPPSLTTEIEQSVETRDKLEAAIAQLNRQSQQLKLAFLRSLAAELQVAEIVPSAVSQRLATWKAEEARTAEQLDALQQLVTLFKDRVETFKTASVYEAASALQNLISRLTGDRGKPGADQNAINARIAKLTEELKPLQTKLPPAPPRDPKEREGPPERKSKAEEPQRPPGKK